MNKTFCDKCEKECTYNNRGIQSFGDFYLYCRKSEGGHDIAHSVLTLCMDCKSKLEKVLEEFLKEK